MSEWVEIELPYPPSVNTYWRHSRGRHYISEKGKAFQFAAVKACEQFDPFVGAVVIKLEVYKPDKRKRDLDNLTKGLFDALVNAGIIEDDNDEIITEYSSKSMGICRPKGKVVVKIRSCNGG